MVINRVCWFNESGNVHTSLVTDVTAHPFPPSACQVLTHSVLSRLRLETKSLYPREGLKVGWLVLGHVIRSS